MNACKEEWTKISQQQSERRLIVIQKKIISGCYRWLTEVSNAELAQWSSKFSLVHYLKKLVKGLVDIFSLDVLCLLDFYLGDIKSM